MAWTTGSIGLVLVEPGEHCDDDSAYRRADETLYLAKAAGRAQLALAPPSGPTRPR